MCILLVDKISFFRYNVIEDKERTKNKGDKKMTREEKINRIEEIKNERFMIKMIDHQTAKDKTRDRELLLEYYRLIDEI